MNVNGIEYNQLRLLGKGKGGYSWLVEKDGRQYVLKQIHHEPCSYYQFGDKLQAELRDYARLQEVGIPIPRMLEVDIGQERILKEFIDGETIMDLVRQDRMEPRYVEQVEQMCQKLYPAGLNIDYFPTNFIPQNGVLYYIDYECNAYDPRWDFEHWGKAYWSKTPEFDAYWESKK